MGIKRIIIGSIILLIGFLSWIDIVYDGMPRPDESNSQLYDPIPINESLGFDNIIDLLVASVITGIGVWILGSGIRSSQSPRY